MPTDCRKRPSSLPADPGDSRVVGARGTAFALAGRSEQAVQLLERQIGLNRNDASAWFWLGYARCTLGRQDEAIAALAQANRLSPRVSRRRRA